MAKQPGPLPLFEVRQTRRKGMLLTQSLLLGDQQPGNLPDLGLFGDGSQSEPSWQQVKS